MKTRRKWPAIPVVCPSCGKHLTATLVADLAWSNRRHLDRDGRRCFGAYYRPDGTPVAGTWVA